MRAEDWLKATYWEKDPKTWVYTSTDMKEAWNAAQKEMDEMYADLIKAVETYTDKYVDYSYPQELSDILKELNKIKEAGNERNIKPD